jgi:hypothetical protein
MMPNMAEKYHLLIFIGVPLVLFLFPVLSNAIQSTRAAKDQYLKDGLRATATITGYPGFQAIRIDPLWMEFSFQPANADSPITAKVFFLPKKGIPVDYEAQYPIGTTIEVAYLNGFPKLAKPVLLFDQCM